MIREKMAALAKKHILPDIEDKEETIEEYSVDGEGSGSKKKHRGYAILQNSRLSHMHITGWWSED